jgi:hypothetical protein
MFMRKNAAKNPDFCPGVGKSHHCYPGIKPAKATFLDKPDSETTDPRTATTPAGMAAG